MNLVEQFNNLNQTTVNRATLERLYKLAKKQKHTEISSRIIKVLKKNNDNEFKIEIVNLVEPFGLNASRHKGVARKGLDNFGRLKKGYKYQDGKVVKVETNGSEQKTIKPKKNAQTQTKPINKGNKISIENKKTTPNVARNLQLKNKFVEVPVIEKETIEKQIDKSFEADKKDTYLSEGIIYIKNCDETAYQIIACSYDNLIIKDKNQFGKELLAVKNDNDIRINVAKIVNKHRNQVLNIPNKNEKKFAEVPVTIEKPTKKNFKFKVGDRVNISDSLGNFTNAIRKITKLPPYNNKNKYEIDNITGVSNKRFLYENQLRLAKPEIIETLNIPKKAQEKPLKPATINKNSLAHKLANKPKNTDFFTILNPDISRFLGKIEKKTKGSVFVSLTGEAGSMKTRLAFQIINAFAQKYKVGHASIEEHPDSLLYYDKVNQYFNQIALNNIESPEIESLNDLHNLIQRNDVIVIDSFTKMKEIDKSFEVDKDLRKKYDGKIFIVIFQQTTNGSMRGGSKSQFDADITMFTEKFDVHTKNFAYCKKNRYNSNIGLKYNIYNKQLLGQAPKVKLKFKEN